MSHDTHKHQSYSQNYIDRFTEQRVLNDAKLTRKGARYVLGHFTITPEQRDEAHATMRKNLVESHEELSLTAASEMSPGELERIAYKNIWKVLLLDADRKGYEYDDDNSARLVRFATTFAQDMGITLDDHGTGYVDFILVGKQLRQSELYQRAVTMSLDGKHIGISKKPVRYDSSLPSTRADEAIVDIQIASGRNTERFSGRGSRLSRYGSQETTLDEKVEIINLLDRLGAGGRDINTAITSSNRAVFKRIRPYRQ